MKSYGLSLSDFSSSVSTCKEMFCQSSSCLLFYLRVGQGEIYFPPKFIFLFFAWCVYKNSRKKTCCFPALRVLSHRVVYIKENLPFLLRQPFQEKLEKFTSQRRVQRFSFTPGLMNIDFLLNGTWKISGIFASFATR